MGMVLEDCWITTLQKTKTSEKVAVKTIAKHLASTPGTVSAALNNSGDSPSIPEHTKKRILEAGRELNYRPNFFSRARSL
jgi:LacI family transcriptional regulator